MNPTITAFRASPDRGRGLARDMIVRWALEEAGQPYDVRLLSFDELKQPAHLWINPFGQIPTFESGDIALFESGAIVLELAQQSGSGLLPPERRSRARAISWMFAAVATIEPAIVEREQSFFNERDKPWHAEHVSIAEATILARLDRLSMHLSDHEWLDGDFSAGDLLMISALRRLDGTALLSRSANLMHYVARGEARPAFRRAFGAQRLVFIASLSAETC
ncbi:glutathione S-transferase [Sphingomonas sp. BE138]|uniref:glutathione S-transferase family protein n=1 Tax=Sphingomonas sp. BE138 TaxID=2817845 RepID=UPI0028669758|nr:glutathione S-transferase family protein [Sphingomonas sp. BE138]MDR6790670.1 glutathione S-transferase [Sphingomonas sp. BE138]